MKNLLSKLKDCSHVLWDWNGTLLDDVDLCVEIISELLHTHQLPKVTRDIYRHQFCFPVLQYYKNLGFDLEKTPFEKLSVEFITRYKARVKNCNLYTGAKDVLVDLKGAGKKLCMLSAAHELDLKELLTHYEISHHFDHVFGLSDHHAKGKVERGHELISKLNTARETIILVGDTDHDVEVAKELGIQVLILADGHHSWERLEKTGARILRSRYSSEPHV